LRQGLLIFISGLMVLYAVILFRSVYSGRELMKREKGGFGFYAMLSTVVMFLSSFGVSDTALTVFAFRANKCVEDRLLPGTIIASSILPVGTMSLAFLSSMEVDPATLAACVVVQTLGAFLGVRLIMKLNGGMIRQIMGYALIGTAMLIVIKLFFLTQSGAGSTGLSSWRLLVALLWFFVFGALNLVGLGATVPNMAVLLLLGVDSRAVFPIVMTGNFISCCLAGFQYVLHETYTRKAAACSVFGVIGVLVAVLLVKTMNVRFLQVIMIGVLLFCACSMLRSPKQEQG